MTKAVWTIGRFNPPTETGHGKLINSVKNHASSIDAHHYVFPTHSHDKKRNPLSHDEKVETMRKLFPDTNIVSDKRINSPISALQHLEAQGHKHVTMIVGGDRVKQMHDLVHKYNGDKYHFDKIHVKSAGDRDPKSKGVEGVSATKLRTLVTKGKRREFVKHYRDQKLGKEIYNKVRRAMNESSTPKAMFIMGGPGSGKDYVINNILSRFNLIEVQIDQIMNGSEITRKLIENKLNLLINGAADPDKIQLVKNMLEGYEFSHTLVSVSNKVSRERNDARKRPLNEQKRIRRWLDAEKITMQLENIFTFKNSLNLNESSEKELMQFQKQIEQYLEFLIKNDFVFLEALEWGTDETLEAYRKATPGEQDTVIKKPKLTVRKFKKGLVVPPNNINARIDGAGGYNLGVTGASAGLGGMIP